MKHIAIIILVFSGLHAAAQKHEIGVRGGLNIAGHTMPEAIITLDDAVFPRMTAGISYEYLLNEHFSIGVDALYNQRGTKTFISFTDEMGNYIVERATVKYEMDYLSIPLKINYKTGGNLYGVGGIGIMPSYLIRSQLRTPSYTVAGTSFPSESYDQTDSFNSMDWGGIVELGAGYKTAVGLTVFVLAGYQYSFTEAKATEYSPSMEIRHYGYMISAGVKYALGN